MKRLAGIDANFLYSESPTVPMHTLKVVILDLPPLPGVALFEYFKRGVERRLHLLPGYRRRVVTVPLGLHHPVWVEDPDFELDRHLHHRTIAAPGGRRQLEAAIAQLAATPLRRDRPLWELWMLDGLAEGGIAVVTKLHHAVADGGSALRMLTDVTAELADAAEPDAGSRWTPEPMPTRRRLVRDALAEQPRRARRLAALMRDTAHWTAELSRRRKAEGRRVKNPFTAPRTVFNCTLPAGRTFATTRLPLEPVKAIKRALKVSVNDVVMALAGGATLRYLRRVGPLPDQPLIASVPVSVGASLPTGETPANALSNMLAPLFTQIADPIDRVRAIHADVRKRLAAQTVRGGAGMRDWAEYTPGRTFGSALRLYERFRMADVHRPPVNLIVSNVRGPEKRLFAAGAGLRDLYSVGPILNGLGLNLTTWSYDGHLGFAALSHDRLPLPLYHLTDALHEALDELLARAVV